MIGNAFQKLDNCKMLNLTGSVPCTQSLVTYYLIKFMFTKPVFYIYLQDIKYFYSSNFFMDFSFLMIHCRDYKNIFIYTSFKIRANWTDFWKLRKDKYLETFFSYSANKHKFKANYHFQVLLYCFLAG